MKTKHILFIIILVICFIFTNYSYRSLEYERNKRGEEEGITLIERELSFEDSIKLKIKEYNIAHPYIVYSQALLETGHFTSNIFKENNNIFGFQKVYKRETTQIGVNKGHAVYNNWEECIQDYALYQEYCGINNLTEEEYLSFLEKYYATDKHYSNKLRLMLNNLKKVN